MERSGIHLDPINPSIVFVRTCFLRRRLVPHFVVRTEHGDATVMIMPHEYVKKPERFDGNGYKGVIVSDEDKGSVILLSRQEVDLDRYAGEIRRAVHMLPPEAPRLVHRKSCLRRFSRPKLPAGKGVTLPACYFSIV